MFRGDGNRRPGFRLRGLDRLDEAVHGEHPVAVHADRIEDHRLQLPDIAGKAVGGQELRQSLRGGRLFLTQGVRRLCQEVIEQQRDVAAPRPERRNLHPMGAQAVIEVAAKRPGALPGREVLMGGDDDPRPETFGEVATEREILPFLEQPQQLHLGRDAEISDLVQKERAVGRLLNHAPPDLLRAGEGATHVAEKGIGKDRVVEPGHVDRHQLAAAAAQAVGGLGNQLLPHPALPGDQKRLGTLGHRLHVGEDVQHGAVAGDDGGERLGVRQFPGDQAV